MYTRLVSIRLKHIATEIVASFSAAKSKLVKIPMIILSHTPKVVLKLVNPYSCTSILKMTQFKPDPLLFTAQNFEVNSSYNRSSHGSIQISKIPISNEKSTGYDSPVLNSEVCWIIMYTAVNFSIFRTAYSMLLHIRFCSTAWP